MSYSLDLRKRVMAYHFAGHTLEETSETFDVAINTISKWKKLIQENGTLDPREKNRSFRKIDPERLEAFVREKPNAGQSEAAELFGCTASAICRAMKILGIRRKKRPGPPTRQMRERNEAI